MGGGGGATENLGGEAWSAPGGGLGMSWWGARDGPGPSSSPAPGCSLSRNYGLLRTRGRLAARSCLRNRPPALAPMADLYDLKLKARPREGERIEVEYDVGCVHLNLIPRWVDRNPLPVNDNFSPPV